MAQVKRSRALTRDQGLFLSDTVRVFSLPPAAAFLQAVAAGLIDETGARQRPEALADALIFTPNRRSARELALSLYREMGGAMIMPRIRALGDIEEGDEADSIGPEALEAPPALSAGRRRGALARLIQAWRQAEGDPALPPGSALAAADELASLLDQAEMNDGGDWERLETLSLEADLAEHWRRSSRFLDIVVRAWPRHLQEIGRCDGLTRRRLAAEALAARWRKRPPVHPVIIAGSTGAAAATRRLMAAVMTLPQGAVILPGLDPDLDDAGWDAIGRSPSHPQFALRATLESLRIAPSLVRKWPAASETPAQAARRRLINEALAPAETTRGWNDRLREMARPEPAGALVEAGLEGVTLIEAEDENEEAMAAALLLRETLERPGQTAALVTPEASLGRRVSAILKRWDIHLEPSAGTAFNRSRCGGFLLLVMRWARDPADPVLLLALLKHDLTQLGLPAGRSDLAVSVLERGFLRGPRLSKTLDDLIARCASSDAAQRGGMPEALERLSRLSALLRPYHDVFSQKVIDGVVAAEACAQLAQGVAAHPDDPLGERLWSGRSGAMGAAFIEQLRDLCGELGGVDAGQWCEFADAVASRMTLPPELPEHDRLAIWGPLEARLQSRDRIILAGLNEGSWPKPAPIDAFLNRRLRKLSRLPDPDERIGLSAHDFAQLANAPEVILLRARRVDDKPSVASRWIWRLRTLSAGGLGDTKRADLALAPTGDRDPIAWLRALRRVDSVQPARPPAPRPPLDRRRLLSFSPSRAGQLIRDPYGDFARRVLGLKRLLRAGADIDAAQRGTAVHDAVEAHEASGRTLSLDYLITERLVAAGASANLIEFERPLWIRAAQGYLKWLETRAPEVMRIETEVEAKIVFDTLAGQVTLGAKADRVEGLRDGAIAIIDFKTGQPKGPKQVETGLEPQLPLEAAIATRVGFGAIAPGPVRELIYYRMSASTASTARENGQPLKLKAPPSDVAEDILTGLIRLINQYAEESTPYLSKPRAEFAWSPSDYDRLARRAEWTTDEGEE